MRTISKRTTPTSQHAFSSSPQQRIAAHVDTHTTPDASHASGKQFVHPSHRQQLQPGALLGHYRLRRHLMQSSMASIYLGYHEQTQQLVALKIVDLAGDRHSRLRTQFEREVEIMSMLHHEHILPLLDVGYEENYAYLVMPYISGGTLQDRLAKEVLSIEEAGSLLEQLGTAVQYMHERGLLHRDIKPSNILLDEDGHLYLADFGIAAIIDEETIVNGRIMGTPIYMAPELYQGYGSESSDIYAVGILLYEMLTGFVPFDGENAIDICRKHLYEQPMPLSLINTTLPRAIEQVVLCALEKEPAFRFQSAQHLIDAYTQALYAPTLTERAHIRLSTILTGLKAQLNRDVPCGHPRSQ